MTAVSLTDNSLGHRHGFFTRIGGVSTGYYEGLNCGFGSKDGKEAVAENRKRVYDVLKTDTINTVFQHHSDIVISIQDQIDPATKADAMVTNQPGVALGVLSADCAPILFSDPKNNVIGAAHSGWKGSLHGISENVVSSMVELGADRSEITAVVGPCISQANYEVGQEFLEQFMDEDPNASQFFVNGAAGKYQFDLPGFCLSHLRGLGIKDASWIGHCTYADEERFYSYRRTTHRGEPDYGRLISAIVI